MRKEPPEEGTATRPLARSVERKISKYSDLLSGRSVTTETLPCTRLSMMKVRPVALAASWMKARISASRTLRLSCASAGAPMISAEMNRPAMRRLKRWDFKRWDFICCPE